MKLATTVSVLANDADWVGCCAPLMVVRSFADAAIIALSHLTRCHHKAALVCSTSDEF